MIAGLVSVVIVSRDRPEVLRLCLLALSQQYHAPFEVVVVADAAGIKALDPDWTGRVVAIPFDAQNISAARNAGIAAASGQVIAFIDDDATAEPTWLHRLTTPVLAGLAPAAGGLVLGRNGISVQWGARRVLSDGSSVPVSPAPAHMTIYPPEGGSGLKTEGTNMAFSANLLRELNGFDPAFRFYLDETDLDLRIAKAGLPVAFVPGAIVHHGFAASRWRRRDRVPRTLFDLGASLALFLRKHAPGGATDVALTQEGAHQRKRLIGHMVAGRLEPGEISRLLSSLKDGWAEGLTRGFGGMARMEQVPASTSRMTPPATKAPLVLSGRPADRDRLMAQALAETAWGGRATVQIFSRTALYHRRWFASDGVWRQEGGLFGRSRRDDPLFRRWRLVERSEREWSDVAAQRSADDL